LTDLILPSFSNQGHERSGTSLRGEEKKSRCHWFLSGIFRSIVHVSMLMGRSCFVVRATKLNFCPFFQNILKSAYPISLRAIVTNYVKKSAQSFLKPIR